jgi:hypothetical protein
MATPSILLDLCRSLLKEVLYDSAGLQNQQVEPGQWCVFSLGQQVHAVLLHIAPHVVRDEFDRAEAELAVDSLNA